jgi:hypothetical protein
VTELLQLRGVIGQEVERARQAKLIGNALEARVVLRCAPGATAGLSKKNSKNFSS